MSVTDAEIKEVEEFEAEEEREAELARARLSEAQRIREEDERRRREEEERLRREEEERKKRELEETELRAREAKSALIKSQLTVFKMMFPGEYTVNMFTLWRRLIPTSLDEVRTHPGRNFDAIVPEIKAPENTRKVKRNHMGIPLPSPKSINDASVVHYSSFDDIRLWLDAEAWIGDNQAIDAIILAADSFIVRSFPNKINTTSFQLAARGFFHYGRSPEAISTIIVDSLLELFNEMCLVPGNLIPHTNRREPGPFFKTAQFGRLSKAAKDRMPNVATHYRGSKTDHHQ